MDKGFFITFEGGEGVGKTTQIKHLKRHLKDNGHDIILTREPGGTPAAEEIRSLLSHPAYGGKWTPEAEAMLLFAARAMHIKEVIAPALQQGQIVICDRYTDSTRVYQSHLQGLGMDFIDNLEKQIVGKYKPDLTFILDLPAQKAMERVQSRGAKDHYDRGNLEFYNKLRQGFLDIAAKNPERCDVVDATADEKTIADHIFSIVSKRLS